MLAFAGSKLKLLRLTDGRVLVIDYPIGDASYVCGDVVAEHVLDSAKEYDRVECCDEGVDPGRERIDEAEAAGSCANSRGRSYW